MAGREINLNGEGARRRIKQFYDADKIPRTIVCSSVNELMNANDSLMDDSSHIDSRIPTVSESEVVRQRWSLPSDLNKEE